LIGKTISHYKILEKLGEGGMGVVYKAQDTKLHRTVALKFLRPQAITGDGDKTRFIHEAQAAAALDNPNICTVYEIGETESQTYISMAYIEGQSIKERIQSGSLELVAALDIAIQAASGLQAAHSKGITHRDIKSANVMVTPEGQVKIMDFGLAKTVGATQVTKTGTTLGTAAYMSPEQALGQPTDHRTDIWSLGVVLYEMLTGRLPFKGEYDPALMYAIVNEEPEPVTSVKPEVPLEVERVVGKALTKNPDKRYQSADELITDLQELQESLDLLPKRSRLQLRLIRRRRQIAVGVAAAAAVVVMIVLGIRYFTGSARAIDSIAVLPFEDISGNPEQEYKADGMTRELTAVLGQISAWTVKSSRSMMMYKGTNKSPSDIAAEVGAKALLEVSIKSLSGDRIEAIVELIDGSTEELLWAQPFEYGSSEINNLYNEIARVACERVGIALTLNEDARLASARPVNPEAYDLYLKAQYLGAKVTKEAYEKAVEYYQKAIEIDPNYAQAYAGLAGCYVFLGYFGHMPVKEASSRTKAFVKKALEIDDTLSEAHFALAVSRFQIDWNWVGAEEEFKQSIELNPNLAEALNQYAWLLTAMGRFEEAIAEAKRALQLDPVSYWLNQTLAWIYYCARQYDQAIERFQQIAELEQNNPAPYEGLAMVYEQTGMYEDAVRARQQSMILSGDPPEEVAALDSAYSESGIGHSHGWKRPTKSTTGRYIY